MTKLEELKKAMDEARDAYYAEDDKLVDAETAYDVAFDAYEDEYRKIYHHPPVQLTGVIEATTVVTPVSVVDTSKEARRA